MQAQIAVIYGGGTISSVLHPDGYREGGRVLDLVTELQQRRPAFKVNHPLLSPTVAYTGLSENLDPEYWLIFGQKIDEALEQHIRAIVITHGTDSMEQTARYLEQRYDAVLKERKVAIILTGADHDAAHIQTDVWSNLELALSTADTIQMPGVFVAFRRRVIPAAKVVKSWFDGELMYYMEEGSVEQVRSTVAYQQRVQTVMKKLLLHKQSPRPQNSLVMTYAVNKVGLRHEDFLQQVVVQQPKAIVFTLYHSGTANVEKPEFSVADLVRKLRTKYGVVCFAVTENAEPVNLHLYNTSVMLRKAGLVPLYDMLPEVAIIKLKSLTEQTRTEIVRQMLAARAGEITEATIQRQDIEALLELYA